MYNPYILERDKFVQASRAIDKELMLRLTAVGAVSYSAWVDFYASLSGMKFLNSRKIETTARRIDKLYEKAQDDWSHFAATKGLSFAYGDVCTDHAYKLALNDLLIELFTNYYYGTMKSWKMLGVSSVINYSFGYRSLYISWFDRFCRKDLRHFC